MTQPLDRSLLIKGLKVLGDTIEQQEMDYKAMREGILLVIDDLKDGGLGLCRPSGCNVDVIRERLEKLVAG